MQNLIRGLEARIEQVKQFRTPIAVGAVLFLLASITLLYFILNDKFRQTPDAQLPGQETVATSTEAMLPRRLDGVLVPAGQEALRPIAIMVENHTDARPWSGLDQANVVFEAPVEGGITRFMAIFDSTSTVNEVGPVRSARPYYVDWAAGYKATYAHVGGSPDALDKIKALSTSTLFDINEFYNGSTYWRDNRRVAPHNVYTSAELLLANMGKKNATSTMAAKSWSFQDEVTTTDRGDNGSSVSIPYGGSYNVIWKYDKEQNRYVRQNRNSPQTTRDGKWLEAKNVIVILTDSKVLDDIGRLEVRTVGSGDATMYRDGKTYLIRWKRSPGEPMKFEGRDGADVLLNRGTTWVEVTTDSRIYAGLGV